MAEVGKGMIIYNEAGMTIRHTTAAEKHGFTYDDLPCCGSDLRPTPFFDGQELLETVYTPGGKVVGDRIFEAIRDPETGKLFWCLMLTSMAN